MPAMTFRVRWPDGGVESCYSPSTVVERFFEPGQTYALDEFLEIARRALHAASDRVRERYGSGCGRAMAQLASIEATAKRYAADAAPVKVEGFDSR